MKNILIRLGVLKFLAIKQFYNKCVDSNDFYKMLKRRLKYHNSEDLAIFLNSEFEIHCKEFAQYQN